MPIRNQYMPKELLFFDPKDRPFGFLSNNYVFDIPIGHQTWPMVSKYVYASLTNVPTYKNIIKLTPLKEAKQVTEELVKQETSSIVAHSIQDVLKAKLSMETSKFRDALIATANSPLEYRQDDEVVDDFSAMLVKYLYQLRHGYHVAIKNLERTAIRDDYFHRIYARYHARNIIYDVLNAEKDIRPYYNKTPTEIIEIAKDPVESTKRDAVIRRLIEKKNTMVMEDIVYVDYPETLVPSILKERIAIYAENKSRKLRVEILNSYLNYLLEKEFPDVPPEKYELAKKQQLGSITQEKRIAYANKIWELYTEGGALSERWSQKADEIVDKYYIPSQKEIESYENYVMPDPEQKKEMPYTYIQTALSGEKSVIYPIDSPIVSDANKKFLPLSPYYEEPFQINGFRFLAMWQYIYANLLRNLKAAIPGGLLDVYNNIIKDPKTREFRNKKDVEKLYMEKISENTYKTVVKAAKIALEVKFDFKEMQDVLLMTGDAKLVWGDATDPILGIGPDGKGGNNVGIILGEIRQKIIKESIKNKDIEKEINVTLDNFDDILIRDFFIRDWLVMRIFDIDRIIRNVKYYVTLRFPSEQPKLTRDFATDITDLIYQPCSHVYGKAESVIADVPKIFVEIAKGTISLPILEVIWKRIAVLLYNAYSIIKTKNMKTLREIISISEQLTRNNDVICTEFTENNKDNCIISALLNIVGRILEFNKNQGYITDTDDKITDIEIKTAVSILVGKNMTENICADPKTPIKKHSTSNYEEGEDLTKMDYDFFNEDAVEDDQEYDDADNEDYEDYGDEYEDDYGGDGMDSSSPVQDATLALYLKEQFNVNEPSNIIPLIHSAVSCVKNWNMPALIKDNRINFFLSPKT